MKKKILVIGGGGREHAICWALNKSETNPEIFCAPGNAGIAQIARCIDISPTNLDGLVNFSISNTIDLTIVGGEISLAAGIVDEFEKHNLRIIGPSLAASRLESSKSFAKDFMMRHKIPTAPYRTVNSVHEAISILQSGEFGNENTAVVVKADGLAAGKGVIMAKNHSEAIAAVKEAITNENGESNNQRVLLEQTLVGHEVSLLLFSDGKSFALMPLARDHKRIADGDRGANTGGMGTVTDKSLLSEVELQDVVSRMVEPTLNGVAKEGFPFRGILFLGLMMTTEGAKLLEYNVRFGDPEAQSILVRLESDFVTVCESIIEGQLGITKVEFSNDSSVCIILASRGYPTEPELGDVLKGLEKVPDNVLVFHSGTRKNEKSQIITAGGRVLGITTKDKNIKTALENAYKAIETIDWKGMQYRRDIGKKLLQEKPV